MTYPPHDPWNYNEPEPPYGHQDEPGAPYGNQRGSAPPYGHRDEPVSPYGHQGGTVPPYGYQHEPPPSYGYPQQPYEYPQPPQPPSYGHGRQSQVYGRPQQPPYGYPQQPYGYQHEAAPGYGHQAPGGYGHGGPAYHGPQQDPLVPAPEAGYRGWFEHIRATLTRSWQSLGLVLLVTMALPDAVLAILGFAAGRALTFAPGDLLGIFGDAGPGAAMFLLILVFTVASWFAKALGWAAGIWTVTEEAAGRSAPLPDALRAGLARALPMFGWYLLVGVLVAIGTVFCFLPGLYLAVATSLFGFVLVFERGANPVARSLKLVNGSFWSVLGRVLSLFGVYLGVAILLGDAFGLATATGGDFTGGQLGGALVQAVLAAPLYGLLLVGLMITYTEVRAKSEPLATHQLWSAANY